MAGTDARTTHSFVAGADLVAADTYDNVDPATGAAIGGVGRGGEREVDAAVRAAAGAT